MGKDFLRVEDVARACHEATRALRAGLGDYSVPPWDVAGAWERQAARDVTQFVFDHPLATAEQVHEQWRAGLVAAGWKRGAAKRPETLEHPDLASWATLPPARRAPSILFLAVAAALSPLVVPGEDEPRAAIPESHPVVATLAVPTRIVTEGTAIPLTPSGEDLKPLRRG